jgi:hypothetical protein
MIRLYYRGTTYPGSEVQDLFGPMCTYSDTYPHSFFRDLHSAVGLHMTDRILFEEDLRELKPDRTIVCERMTEEVCGQVFGNESGDGGEDQ